jgi:hypothetical protein
MGRHPSTIPLNAEVSRQGLEVLIVAGERGHRRREFNGPAQMDDRRVGASSPTLEGCCSRPPRPRKDALQERLSACADRQYGGARVGAGQSDQPGRTRPDS